jgi:hypothetical protein
MPSWGQAQGAYAGSNRWGFSHPHLSFLVRMDIPREHTVDHPNHWFKHFQHRCSAPIRKYTFELP